MNLNSISDFCSIIGLIISIISLFVSIKVLNNVNIKLKNSSLNNSNISGGDQNNY